MRFDKIARRFGAAQNCFIDDAALGGAVSHFQRNCLAYWRELEVEDPSHLKIFGSLLYSLTQRRDESGRRIDFVFFDEAVEGDTKERRHRRFLVDHFHEFACFTAVFEMFIAAQVLRTERIRFDQRQPPASDRYTRSIVDYLRDFPHDLMSRDRTPFDLYMIFKSMDLFGMYQAGASAN